MYQGNGATVRMLRGTPDDTELAALTAVLTGVVACSTATTWEQEPLSMWASRATLLRRLPASGPNAWRASALPLR